MNNIASWIWVLIPLAAIGIAPFKMWLRSRRSRSRPRPASPPRRARNMPSTWSELEARLRVLEQIVTDGGAQTAAQIEALRDQDRIEAKDKVQ